MSVLNFTGQPGGVLKGQFRVPGDKSISHRSIILGSLAEGTTHISGFLEGEDSLHTLQAFQQMGVQIENKGAGEIVVHGKGLGSLRAPEQPIYLGNSGTAMRLMAGVLAGQNFNSEMGGDQSLSGRPMGRVIDPLREMGASVSSAENKQPPLQIQGGNLRGISYAPAVASAQIKSCLLLAGLFAEGRTTVTESGITRDHTERMLRGFGYPVEVDGMSVSVTGGGNLTATTIDVPSDISSAAFLIVGASIAEGSDITLQHVGVNPSRTGIIDIMRLMGANIEVLNEREIGGEPVADIRIQSSQLHGIEVPEELVPRAIDEFPVLFVAAACAQGETTVSGAAELRVKESDRIQVMVDGLNALGIQAKATPDGAIIQGGQLGEGRVDSHGDHRTAMAFTIASLRCNGSVTVADCDNVNTSFPGFVNLICEAGLVVSESRV